MKFVCEKCSAKYNIADSKVRNKVLKIRCKSCGNIIEVRGDDSEKKDAGGLEGRFAASFKDGAAGATPGLFDAVKKSAERMEKDETELTVWFVAVDDNPVGPVTARFIHKKQKAGKVDDDSLVWKEGMPDWIRLRNCKDLVGLLAKIDIEASLGGGEEKPVEEAAPRMGLFSEKADAAEPVDSPLKGGSVGVLADRLDAPEVSDDVPEAPPPSPGAPDPLSDDFSEGMKSNLASLQSIMPVSPTGRGDRWVKIAAVGFFGVAVCVLVLVFAIGESPTEEIVKVVEKEKVIEKVVFRDRPVEEKKVRTEEDLGSDESGKTTKKVVGKKPVVKAKPQETKPPQGETAEERKKRLLAQMSGGAGLGDQKLVGGGSSKGSEAGGGSSGTSLSNRQVSTVVNKNKGRLQICYEKSLKKGEAPDDRDVKVIMKLTVGGTGMVKKAGVGGSGASLSGLRSCLQNSVKKWIFPSAGGESKVEFPLLFTPK